MKKKCSIYFFYNSIICREKKKLNQLLNVNFAGKFFKILIILFFRIEIFIYVMIDLYLYVLCLL